MKVDVFTYFVKEAYSKKEFPEHEMFNTDGWMGDIGDIIEWNGKLYEIIDYAWELEDLADQMEMVEVM